MARVLMPDSWSTLVAPTRFAQIIRNSRFAAQAAPIETTDDATGLIIRASADDASHHAWAWRVGEQHRCSDDGEPAGSAGRPILAAIDGQQLDAVVVIVARWFGGTRLGIGGLVRAYGGTAAACLREAGKRRCVRRQRVRVVCDYASAAALHRRLREFDAIKFCEHARLESTELVLDIAHDRIDALETCVRDLTRSSACVERIAASSSV